MSWLPFICLIIGSLVLFVLYSSTVGHIHRMVHQLDEVIGIHEERLNAYSADLAQVAEAIGIHEERLNAYSADLAQVAEILEAMAKRIESEKD